MSSKIVKSLMIMIPVVLLFFGSIITFTDRSAATDKGFTIERDDLKEMKLETANAIAEWKSGDPITVSYPDGTFDIPRTYFDFDLEQSYQSLEEALHTPWFAFWERNELITFSLTADLDEEYLASYADVLDTENTKQNLIILAERLVYDDVNTASPEQSGLHDPVMVQMTTGYAAEAADLLSSFVIDANSEFSFNNMFFNDNEEGLIAVSALYQLFLQTDTVITERHAAMRPPDYTRTGFEAFVSLKDSKDFKVFNQSDFQINIEASAAGNELSVTLTSANKERYGVERVQSNIVKPRTIRRYSNLLAPGEELRIQEGSDGFQVEIYQTQLSASGEVTEDLLVTRDFYPPVPAIIEVSSLAPVQSESSGANVQDDTEAVESDDDNSEETTTVNEDTNENVEASSDQTNQPDVKQKLQNSIERKEENNPK
ncbi:VanW family protein [Jeotgalibacillus malaysiensis]|uniref:VanW family protein n=1 Tax=Jeotgalibacillus malaysiensis TaxID=1508404 RepID=UPI0038510EAB